MNKQFETKEVVINDMTFVLRPMPVLTALKIQKAIVDGDKKDKQIREKEKLEAQKMGIEVDAKALPEVSLPDPEIIFQAIKASASLGSKYIDEKNFDSIFCKKFDILYRLFDEVLVFNFSDEDDTIVADEQPEGEVGKS